MNKVELIEKIKCLDGLSNDDKSVLVDLLYIQKKYGLIWEDKPEKVEEQLEKELPVLTEVKDRAIYSEDPNAPNHILIEGDNLHALTSLSYTHEGKIDVIYIDPPYNTGNKDFIYNDSFVDKEDSYRHSKWLSFMNKRLKIAKQLLSDRGVIFISIDDNEQAQLKLLCDDIFGENNFIGSYFWKRTSTPPALSYKIRRKLEFVLCYQKKDIAQRVFAQGYVDGGDAPLLNSGNPLGILRFPKGSVQFKIPDGVYTYKKSYKIKFQDAIHVLNGKNENDFVAEANFKWGQANLYEEINSGTYFLIKSNKFSIRYQKSTKATKVPSNIVDEDVNVGTNEDAQKEIINFKLSQVFNYAKPTSLISFLCKMPFWDEKNITILDFFAGSGTTLHATMQLNAEDGGKRQCILVTNNENNICEEVTYVRSKKVIQGYITPKGELVDGLQNNTLRFYRTSFVPREQTNKNKRELVTAATDLLCIKNDVYIENNIFGGHRLKSEAARYFDDGKTQMLIIYNELTVESFVEVLRDMKVDEKIKVYVFSNNRYAYHDNFEEVIDKVELCALPAAIYDAYKKVLRPEKNIEDIHQEPWTDDVIDTEIQVELIFSEEGGEK